MVYPNVAGALLTSAGGDSTNRGAGRDATAAIVVCRQQDEIMHRQGRAGGGRCGAVGGVVDGGIGRRKQRHTLRAGIRAGGREGGGRAVGTSELLLGVDCGYYAGKRQVVIGVG